MPLKRIRIGSRSDNRVFNFGGSWSPHEIDRGTEQIKRVFDYFNGWTEAANQIAASLKDRVNPVPIPATLIKQAELLPSGWIHPLGLEE